MQCNLQLNFIRKDELKILVFLRLVCCLRLPPHHLVLLLHHATLRCFFVLPLPPYHIVLLPCFNTLSHCLFASLCNFISSCAFSLPHCLASLPHLVSIALCLEVPFVPHPPFVVSLLHYLIALLVNTSLLPLVLQGRAWSLEKRIFQQPLEKVFLFLFCDRFICFGFCFC